LSWDVFEEREDAVVWVLIPERVHYEPVFCDEGVSIHRSPNLCFFRKYAPPKKDEATIKKAIDAASLGEPLKLADRGLFAPGFEVCFVNDGSSAIVHGDLIIAVIL